MLKYILALAVLVGSAFSARAQTPLLQALIDQTPECGTLTLPADVVYPGPAVIRKCITIESPRARLITIRVGDKFESFTVGAKVVTPSVEPAFNILPGVRGVTIRGLEITATGWVFDIVRIGDTGAAQDTLEEVPQDITLADVAIHGAPDADSQRGVSANGANVSILNSRIYEIHYRGTDSQAICGWNGPGPFRIIGNYLEAAGENVLFGGSDPSIPSLVPSNIEIRQNYFFKPLSWKVGDPSYAGFHWTVKNLVELKNARNVLIDGNVFENNWADGQVGIPILFTVRNQDCTAPWSTVQGVTFTNNTVKNAIGALNFLGVDNETLTANSPTCLLRSNPKPGSVRGTDAVISNNLFYGIRGHFLTLNGFYNVELSRNTHLQQGNFTTLYAEQSWGFRYVDNLTIDHDYGIWGEGGLVGAPALDKWTPGYVFAGNYIAKPYYLPTYPAGNTYLDSLILPGDFRSPYPGKGADIDALLAAQAGATASLPSPSPSSTPTPAPSPTATPTPVPSPSPSPSPLPSPSPSPTPTTTKQCPPGWRKKGLC